MKLRRIVIYFTLSVVFISCADNLEPEQNLYTYRIPDQINDGWTVSSLSEVGMNTASIEQLTSSIIKGDFKGIHSILIVKNGRSLFLFLLIVIVMLRTLGGER